MGSGIYSNRKDNTMQRGYAGTGVAFGRMCSECNQRRQIAGGQTNKRTRMWRCAVCVEKKASE